MKIPKELCIKIISFNFPIKICTCCNKTKLCPEHYNRAEHYGNYYEEMPLCAMLVGGKYHNLS